MSKQRNSDTEIWRDPWHRKLPPVYKSFWRYICDNCDDAGVWKIDTELASFQIGDQIVLAEAFKFCNDGKERIREFRPGYLLILGYIPFHFQSGLSADSGFHKKVIGLIKSYGLEGLFSPYLGDKGTSKGKEREKVKEKGESVRGGAFSVPSLDDVRGAFSEKGFASSEAEKFMAYFDSVGWVVGASRKPMKNWRGAVATWCGKLRESGVKPRVVETPTRTNQNTPKESDPPPPEWRDLVKKVAIKK